MNERTRASSALAARWHAQAVGGPCAGLVAALRGGATIGCEDFPDPAVSHTHLRVSSGPGGWWVSDAGSRNGTYIKWGPVWARMRRAIPVVAGSTFLLGHTRVRVARRPRSLAVTLPRPPRERRLTRILVLPALLITPIMLARMLGLPMWIPLTGAGAAGVVGAAVIARTRDPVPTPAHVLLTLAAGSPPPRPSAQPQPLGAWLGSGRWRRHPLFIDTGERVCLAGPGSRDAARWVAAQLAAGGAARVASADGVIGALGEGPELALAAPDGQTPEGTALTWARSLGDAPAWATRILDVPTACPATSCAWWEHVVAAARAAPDRAAGALPECVLARDHVDLVTGTTRLDAASIAAQWRCAGDAPPAHLRAWIGSSSTGPHVLDLVGDGPHALVAGTTGSGKSEALTTWLLSLACRYPPWALSFVLVDYKGGEAFGPLEALPHTCGTLSDLTPALTRRAIRSLEAEIRRREEARSRGLPAPGRLLIVVDEFRVLAEEEPALLAHLLRVATVGRSLGMHLILATQRPAGIVDAHMRANLPLRLSLRVLEPADSIDVLGVPHAASLPRIPGRALIAGGPAIQVGWSGARRDIDAVVSTLTTAFAACDRPAPRAPWAEPLPTRLPWDARGPANALKRVVGWLDDPEHQRVRSFTLPTPLSMLVVGGPGSGRTTCLRAIAAAVHPIAGVHVIATERWEGVDTWVPPDAGGDTLDLIDACLATPGALLVIDDIDALLAAGDPHAGGAAMSERIATLLRQAPAAGIDVACASSPAQSASRACAHARSRLLLPVTSALDVAHAGLSTGDASELVCPGRAWFCHHQARHLVQIAEPGALSAPLPSPLVVPLPTARAIPGWSAGLVSPRADPLPLDGRSRWIVAAAPGSERDDVCAGLAHRLRSVFGCAQILDAAALTDRDIEREGALVVTTPPARLKAAYTGPLARLRECTPTIMWGSPSDLHGLVPTYARTVAALPYPRPRGLGVVAIDGEYRRIGLLSRPM